MSRDWINYLTSQGATFSDDDNIITFSSSLEEATQNCPTMCVQTSQVIIEATGPDTQRFLQGQLTCNMDDLNPMQHKSGAACNPKGRMYSSFRILNTDSHYLIAMHTGLADTFIATLSKYAVFFKSKLSSPMPRFICLGLTGNGSECQLKKIFGAVPTAAESIAVEEAFLLKTAHLNNCYELWLPENQLPILWQQLSTSFTATTDALWRTLQIKAVIPQVLPSCLEKYIPQHLNLPSLGAVSFRKGCYTGQEIVARMQNLGTQKSRTFHIHFATANNITANVKLVNEKNKPIGELLEIAPSRENHYHALAVLRIDSAENNQVFFADDKDCKITVAPIPYAIDCKAELQC